MTSPYRVRSVLVSPARAEEAAALLARASPAAGAAAGAAADPAARAGADPAAGAAARAGAATDPPLLVAPQEVLSEVAGFDLHRGVVALGERRPFADPANVLAATGLVVVTEGVNDHENLGALYRNAAAFGAGAVLLDPTTADPLYRRSLRVSMGHVLHVPTARVRWPGALGDLAAAGWEVLALTPDRSADDLAMVAAQLEDGRVERRLRVALVVGAEGPGLSAAALAGATRRVRIPMAGPVDSLNVATAAAVALSVVAPLVASSHRS